MVHTSAAEISYRKIGFIRNRDGSFSLYDETADTKDVEVVLQDVYVEADSESYTIPHTPLITNGFVEVRVNGEVTEDYTLTKTGEYAIERKVENTVHEEAVSAITTTTYKQNVILYRFGDANKDGEGSTLRDLVALLKQEAAKDTKTYSKTERQGADVNYDGMVTKEDAKIMRKILCGKLSEQEVRDTYDEVVFGVISDTHYSNDKSDAQHRINTKNALNYYKSQNADLIYMNGDITDYGGTEAYAKLVADITEVYPDPADRPVFLMSADNHEYFNAWSHGNFTPAATFDDLQNRFMTSLAEIRGENVGTNTSCKQSGYHFISISSDGMNGGMATYTEQTKQYLRDALAAAAKEDPKKPIFVGIHQPMKNTVVETEKNGLYADGLEGILKQYPQAVVLTSHTHASIMDERSIWQGDSEGEYTVINTASKVAEHDSLIALQKIVTPEMVEILKDETAYENFKQITGMA